MRGAHVQGALSGRRRTGRAAARAPQRPPAPAMSDFDSNPFADPDLNNPFKVRAP